MGIKHKFSMYPIWHGSHLSSLSERFITPIHRTPDQIIEEVEIANSCCRMLIDSVDFLKRGPFKDVPVIRCLFYEQENCESVDQTSPQLLAPSKK